MTIPAIAPPLRPLLLVVDMPAAAVVAAAPVWKGTVVVAEPVDVTVVIALLVGRTAGVLLGATVAAPNMELLEPPLPLLA